MARRESQGIQIAMIIFILTTLVFMVTTYFGYSASTRLEGEKASLQSDLDTARNGVRSAEGISTKMKESIGFDSAMADDEVTSSLEDALTKTYGAGLDPENQTFLGIIQNLNTRVTELSGKLNLANQDIKKIRAEKQQADEQFKQQLADARASERKAQEDFQTAVTEKQEYIELNDAKNKGYIAAASKAKTDMEQATREAGNKVKEADDRVAFQQSIIEDRQREIAKLTTDTPDQYDGRILGSVAAKGKNTVLINRGRADGLRPKMTFSVYDAADTNVRTAQRKAVIEVTKVLNKTAEARVIETDYIHPIIREDFIASAVWSPGETLGVALVGKIDVDKDGLDDRELIRNLVARGGGRIDADEFDGKVSGPGITVNTRYVVVGDGKLDSEGLMQQADRLSIERLSLSEFVDLMGGGARARTIRRDGVVRPGDYPSDRVERSYPESVNFRPRTPLKRRNTPRY